MRVLMVVNPEKSIFLYLVPLVWALRTAGHEVRVASQPRFADVITSAGLTAVPVGRDHDGWAEARAIPGLVEAYRAGLPAPYDVVTDPDGVTWERVRQGQETLVETAQEQNEPILDDAVAFARHWKPDLVLWEPFSQAGGIVAKACGAAHARMLFGVDVFGVTQDIFRRLRDEQPEHERADPLADWLTAQADKYGFDYTEDIATGDVTIDQFPLSLQTEAPGLTYLRMQFIPYGGRAVVPQWLLAPPRRPRVAMTLGLTATEIFDGYNVPVKDILTALADLDIELIATIAQREQHKLGTLPPNIRIVDYVPWEALIPTCTAVIHHAGAATLATTARHPIPHLALHYHFDQPILARKLTQQGAGLDIHTSQATPDNVRHALHRILTEPTFTTAAHHLRDEIHHLPTPNQLTNHLEKLATDRVSGPLARGSEHR